MHQFGFKNMVLQKVIANLNFIRLNQEDVFLVDTLVFHATWYHQSHCQAKCKLFFLWRKGLVGQCWAGLTLNFNFHCLIQ